jgi:AraC family transcriptional regulator of adaptative response / DNA-3-methyladenine glycosylase II
MHSPSPAWNPSQAARGELDGKFVVGCMGSGTYSLPSCSVRIPAGEQVQLFTSEVAAKNAGLKPCKVCRPDRFHDGEPAALTLFSRLLEEVSNRPAETADVAQLEKQAGLSASALDDLFRDHAHCTPQHWLDKMRNRHAAQALIDGRKPEAAAQEAGFANIRSFEDSFRAHWHMPPANYAELEAGKGFALTLPKDYRSIEVLAYHRRDPLSASERSEGKRIWKALPTDDGPAIIEITIGAEQATVKVTGKRKLSRPSTAFLQRSALRMLGLESDVTTFENAHPELAKRRPGLRLPLLPTAFDALCWAIIGQQINLAFASALRRDMINLAGEEIFGMRAHPSPQALTNLDLASLRAMRYSGSKANYLLNAATQVAAGQLHIERLADGSAVAAQQALLAQKGIGLWTARYVMLRTGFADAAPVGDSALATALQRHYPSDTRPDADQAARLMSRFSPHRSLASMHLWASLRDQD